MQWLALALDFYLAAILGVSGLAKLAAPTQFATTLHQHRLLPRWSIAIVSHLLPLGEVALAGMLLSGYAHLPVAIVVLFLFVVFSVSEIKLFLAKSVDECGCYGVAYVRHIDNASTTASLLLTLLAGLHLALVLESPSVGWQLRALAGVPLAIVGIVLAWRTCRQRWSQSQHSSIVQMAASSISSNLQYGDPFPIELDAAVPSRVFVLFISPHCAPCRELCRALAGTLLDGWTFIIAIGGQSINDDPATISDLVLPSYALPLSPTQSSDLFKTLAIRATPTALAFEHGQLIAQQRGITSTWFARIKEQDASEIQRPSIQSMK